MNLMSSTLLSEDTGVPFGDLQAEQIERVQKLRAGRDGAGVDAALADVAAAARGSQNLLVPMKEALRRRATLGELSDVLREAFGVYQPSR